MNYQAVRELSEEFPVKRLCEVLGVSRSAYYAYRKGSTYQLRVAKALVAQSVKRAFDRHKRRYGSRRIGEELREEGQLVGRYQIRSRMKDLGLVAIQPKGYVPRTTQSDPGLRRCPNLLLEQDNLPAKPNEVIVGDITYLPNEEQGYDKWLYLAIWMDLFSRRIVGWQVDRHMEELLVIEPMYQLIRRRQPGAGLIVHSDGGGQYSSAKFKELLDDHQFRQSMTRKDNHYDNAFCESLFSRIKAELVDRGVFYGLADAQYRLFEYIEGYYNMVRKHSSLGYLSPAQFEEEFWNEQESAE